MSPTSRFHIDPAPEGLRLMQDLLNTKSIEPKNLPDLLADGRAASASLGVELTDTDASKLRALRSTLHDLLSGNSISPAPPVAASITVDASGTVALSPTGSGWQRIASAVWAEVLIAQHTDTLRRLKTCRNEGCASAFYDRSRNNSGAWHNVKTCGNAANLRASRARRKSE